ncbi:MAG: hypothetical protein AXA67_03660 [Methylothermaceae bacteria B42]|nr:MAG: hypothetical protein AXA67_03660 [Methylothermaceae bacteria B42]HHJ38199.1 glutaredoxin family protein [Methylothermaceae bacterium]
MTCQWQLYGTYACHLCEQAQAILQQLGLRYEAIDIALDDLLNEQYGVRIPVLRCRYCGWELDWPFDEAGVRSQINKCLQEG